MELLVPFTDKPFTLTAAQVAEIENQAKLGLCVNFIAAELQTNPETLLENYGEEIAAARLKANLEVLEALYEMAVSGRNLAATAFWIKMHCAALLPAPENQEGWKNSKPPKSSKGKGEYVWDPNDPNDRVIFHVYNNDGEPNADY